MTSKGHYALCFKHVRLSEPTTKIWMNIDPYYQQRRCSPMSLDSGNIRFMKIFAVVLEIYGKFPLRIHVWHAVFVIKFNCFVYDSYLPIRLPRVVKCVTHRNMEHRWCHKMHVANSTKCNCIFTVRVPYAYVFFPEGNVRSHLDVTNAHLPQLLLCQQLLKLLYYIVRILRHHSIEHTILWPWSLTSFIFQWMH